MKDGIGMQDFQRATAIMAKNEVKGVNTVVEFLEELELFGKSYNYINGTRLTLRDFARSCKGENATESDVPVEATEEDIKKWIKDMMERGLCERSRIRGITVLHPKFKNIILNFFSKS